MTASIADTLKRLEETTVAPSPAGTSTPATRANRAMVEFR